MHMRPGSPVSADRLAELLRQAVREACLLEDALERETAALGSADVNALNDAVGRKHQLAQSLERLTREQTSLLLASGFDADGPGMDACLKAWDSEGGLSEDWSRLQQAMERCRRLNQINGGVVRTQQQQVAQAIQLLRGSDGPAELYGPQGRTVSDGFSRHFSKA